MSPTPETDLSTPTGRGMAWKVLALGVAATALEVWLAIVLLRAVPVDQPAAWLGGLALFIIHFAAFRALARRISRWSQPLPLRCDRIVGSYVFHALLVAPVMLVDLHVGVSVLAGSLLWSAAGVLVLAPVGAVGLLIAAAEGKGARR